ncbi:MAG: IS5 family transposase [Acidobacteriaceae bacterium]|nr:IS5 family transposase [Acidobacteriaceae bacterium]
MPHPANQAQCHPFPKAKYGVKNWGEYDQALQQRGSLTIWFTPEAVTAWQASPTGKRGRSHFYSNVAIETGCLLRLAFGRPWRQTEGLLRSIATRLGVMLAIPDHTTFSRRSASLSLPTSLTPSREPMHVVLDSTGLKVYGAGEWQREKHGVRSRRSWRKLHLAVNPDSGEILASELTSNEVGDMTMVTPLLNQVQSPITSVTADGAYDGEPVYHAIAARQPDSSPAVIIPPRATAVPSSVTDTAPSLRDRHSHMIREKGRRSWQKAVSYGRRALVETAMFRYKTLIGPRLRARTLATQKTEARLACSVINRMTQLGMPISQRVR